MRPVWMMKAVIMRITIIRARAFRGSEFVNRLSSGTDCATITITRLRGTAGEKLPDLVDAEEPRLCQDQSPQNAQLQNAQARIVLIPRIETDPSPTTQPW